MKLFNFITLMLCVLLIVIQTDGQELLINGWLGLAAACLVLCGLAIANIVSATHDLGGDR